MKIYRFIQLYLSRNIEYRADKQASQVVGGQNMAHTLSLLGGKGYFSLFSTHPLTKNRIKKIKNIDISDNLINPVFLSREIFIITIILLIFLCYFSYKLANVNNIINDYKNIAFLIKNKYIFIKTHLMLFLQK